MLQMYVLIKVLAIRQYKNECSHVETIVVN